MLEHQSENITELAKALLCVQRTVQPVTKDAENPFTKSWYASLNSVMGESSTNNLTNTIEVTFSTRSLLRWGDLTVRFQPLAHQGVQPITYALDRALAYRASRETRAMPDNQLAANNAIGVAQKLGFEVYGLGIRDEHITHLLPHTSKVVNDLPDLVPAMFAMLQAALLKGGVV